MNYRVTIIFAVLFYQMRMYSV